MQDETKYTEIAKNLLNKLGEHTYVVISNSMFPFIKKQDKVICFKKEVLKIKKYDIVAFHNRQNLEVPLVHRIIKIINKDNKIFFKTKGDNSLSADKELIEYNQIIGVVRQIIRNKSVKSLDKTYFKIYSLFIYFIMSVFNSFKSVFIKVKNLIKKEKKLRTDDNLIVLRQSVLTKINDWKNITKQNINLLNEIIKDNLSVCDVSFGGGYCEESFNFIRNKIKVDYKAISQECDTKYDVIICSRVINIVENCQKRQQIYNYLISILNDNGKILISYINQTNGLFLKLKRKFYKTFTANYDGPLFDDITYNDIFVMKQVLPETIYKELIKNNIKVLKKIEKNNVVSFICSKI